MVIIDSNNHSWTIEFLNCIIHTPNGTSLIEHLLSDHTSVIPLPESPLCIFTYQDMVDENPYQDICKINEVVLSKDFVSFEEEIQVLTYEQLRNTVKKFGLLNNNKMILNF